MVTILKNNAESSQAEVLNMQDFSVAAARAANHQKIDEISQQLENLSLEIVRQQKVIRDAEDDRRIVGEIASKMRNVRRLLPDNQNRQWCENQIYSAVMAMLAGRRSDAQSYLEAMQMMPEGFLEAMRNSSRSRQILMIMDSLGDFMFENKCVELNAKVYEHECFRFGIKLLLNYKAYTDPMHYIDEKIFVYSRLLGKLKQNYAELNQELKNLEEVQAAILEQVT